LHLKKEEHISEVLLSLHIDDIRQVHLVVCVSLDVLKVFVKDEFHPDFTDFLVNGSGLINHVFFLVVFS
jgi:hypothetical protein